MPTPSRSGHLIEVFYSYSHKDESLRCKLETHLKILRKQGLISEWHDRQIKPSDDWKHEIDSHLNNAHLILLLVSSDFLASDYCSDVEVARALERHQAGEAKVIPIILRPCKWQNAQFSSLQALPKDAKPVSQWKNRDLAFLNIVEGIEKATVELLENAKGLSSDWINSILLRKNVVRYVQRFLVEHKYLGDGIDGIPGTNTKRAVRKFQIDYGLKSDGLIGPLTLDKIEEVEKSKGRPNNSFNPTPR
jgi:peptidoglycan hydrolase-like protein with peptidoglycan-binding domain